MEAILQVAIQALEIVGGFIIVIGAASSLFEMARAAVGRRLRDALEAVRLQFGQRLVLALEFLIAADILATLRAPTLEGVALLGAIIVVRTVLSLSIAYELRSSLMPVVPTAPSGEAVRSGDQDRSS